MHVVGGYKTMSPVQICNGLGAYDAGLVRYGTLRSYFACVAVMASREAARRARKESVNLEHQVVRAEELAKLTGSSEGVAARDLKQLARVGLIEREGDLMRVAERLLPCAGELVESASPSRSWTRPIPVPRAVLRFLATCKRPAVSKALLAHVLRGLTLDRRTGEVRGRGTVKSTWVASTFGISLRASKAARASLISMGLIGRDEGSTQRKLNLTGAYFEFNLAWSRAGSALRPSRIGTESAPPRERLETPLDLENQRTSKAGVLSGPDFGNVCSEDLERCSRMEELFWQAVDRRLLRGSEMDALNFLAASVRARAGKARDPVRVFVGIVRRGLWAHITCAEEERARAALSRHRERVPEAFRERPRRSGGQGPWACPEVRKLVQNCLPGRLAGTPGTLAKAA